MNLDDRAILFIPARTKTNKTYKPIFDRLVKTPLFILERHPSLKTLGTLNVSLEVT